MPVGIRRSVGVGLVSLCALAGGSALTSAPALAAAPEAPSAVSVEGVKAGEATLHGVLNPGKAGEEGTYEFLYKASKTECTGGSRSTRGLSFGFEHEELPAQVVTGLQAHTEYTVCLLARNLGGQETVGPAVTFKTFMSPEAPELSKAEVLNGSTVKLQGVLNPGAEGEAGSYEFVYRRSASECQRENPETGQKENEYATSTEGALGHDREVAPAVPVEVGGLSPNTAYSVCLLARNEAGETALSPSVSFTTSRVPPAVEAGSGSFSHVTASSALVGGVVNMGNVEGGYFYTYGTTGQFEDKTARSTSETSIFTGNGPVVVPAELTGLQADTEYHFMLVVTNKFGEVAFGEVVTFHTLPAGGLGLPDGRVFEMVTPPNNDNADVYVPAAISGNLGTIGTSTRLPFQVAANGNAVTYPGDPTTGGYGISGLGTGDQYLATHRAAGGWDQVNIQPASRSATHYRGFSREISTGILVSGADSLPRLPPLSPNAPGSGYAVLYACEMTIEPCSEPGDENGTPFLPLYGQPLNRLPEEFAAMEGGSQVYGAARQVGGAVFAGSAGTSDLLLEANDALPNAGPLGDKVEEDVKREIVSGEDNDYLYEWSGGQLSVVDVLPDGEVAGNAAFGAPAFPTRPSRNPPNFSNVISQNGNLVFWTDLTSGVVYVRVGGVETIQVSQGTAPARYWTSADDGQYVFYTEGENEQEELYRFDVVTRQREVLAGAGADVLGVIGTSGDGEEIYAVAKGLLGSHNSVEGSVPVEGQPNLYFLRFNGKLFEPAFIGTLSSEDGNEAAPFIEAISQVGPEYGDWQPGLGNRTAEVSAEGSAVFMSSESLRVVGYPKGYPNNGLAEVYMFDAPASELFCVSCSASGEVLPHSNHSAAAFLPISWSDTYIPQWISEDGNRVFFDSGEPLVPQATDGLVNVYEWEREGSEGCAPGAGVNGGCIYLLSGGTSESDSWFVGASSSGNDAFIVTRAQLTPEDHDEAFNLFDAHVCNTGERCSPPAPPACTGTGCQGVPAAPPIFATPPSVTAEGPGNPSPPPPPPVTVKKKTVKCLKGRKRNKHNQCVKVKTKHRKAKRAGNDRRTQS
jgi:hypothetical protein